MKRRAKRRAVSPARVTKLSERIKMLSERLTSVEEAIGHLQVMILQEPVAPGIDEVEIIDADEMAVNS